MTLLLGVCTVGASSIVEAIYERVVSRSKSFHQMDHDESFLSATAGSISCHQVQTAASSQDHLHLTSLEQLERGLLEKKEASLQVHATQEMQDGSTGVSMNEPVQTIVTKGTSLPGQ
ncbi:uncharacterized protein AKAME5_000631600 [Lates japonicus]|uniref:Uncharacterized protein n=1 Tax=Lates japonicus TaxID=270547 RepID=A0AAD3MHJ2_LATJO|nr:uncharacterized protein AKAME5_000631600 [Lates japonicus]